MVGMKKNNFDYAFFFHYTSYWLDDKVVNFLLSKKLCMIHVIMKLLITKEREKKNMNCLTRN